MSIGYPIGTPIGSHRVGANRGRIAPIVSCRVVSCRPLFSSGGLWLVSGYDQIQRNRYLRALAAPIGIGETR